MKLKNVSSLWWLHPLSTIILAVSPFVIGGHLMSGYDFDELWKTQKYFTRDSAIVEIVFFLAIAAGVYLSRLIPSIGRTREISQSNPTRLKWLFIISATLTFLGYLLWAGYSYYLGIRFSDVWAILCGSPGAIYRIRNTGGTLSGVSTATQFGMSAMIFGVMLARQIGWRRVGPVLCILLFLAMARGILWSERLALIELSVPLFVLLAQTYVTRLSSALRQLVVLTPLLTASGLYLYFTVSEYFRSWTSHYSTMGMSIWYFSWTRLSGYYITALNNGALSFHELGTLPAPFTTFEWFWKFPLVSAFFPYDRVFGTDPRAYEDSLKEFANPEFNNPSGIFPYASDFGVIGSVFFWLVVGFAVGKCYTSFRKGGIGGTLFYPLLYISLLEMARVCYLTSARSSPSWFMLFVGFCILPRRASVVRQIAKHVPNLLPRRIASPRVG